MDIATLVGFLFGVFCIVVSILLNGSILNFYDVPSMFITVGGGLASVFISYRVGELAKMMKVVVKTFVAREPAPEDIIRRLVEMSQKARREGLLSLENEAEEIEDDFLRQSLQLVVDGAEPEVIIESVDLELENLKLRHERGQGIFRTMASLFPAWGMIGTLIGLINLLKYLDDPSRIGPSMAVALITTFYGAILANFVCTPIANKLALKSKEEIQLKRMMVEGVLSIQAGENPRIMEIKLKTFLSPEQKAHYDRQTQELMGAADRMRTSSDSTAT